MSLGAILGLIAMVFFLSAPIWKYLTHRPVSTAMYERTKAAVDKNPNLKPDEVRQALAGNLCRCGAYPKILESVLSIASKA